MNNRKSIFVVIFISNLIISCSKKQTTASNLLPNSSLQSTSIPQSPPNNPPASGRVRWSSKQFSQKQANALVCDASGNVYIMGVGSSEALATVPRSPTSCTNCILSNTVSFIPSYLNFDSFPNLFPGGLHGACN